MRHATSPASVTRKGGVFLLATVFAGGVTGASATPQAFAAHAPRTDPGDPVIPGQAQIDTARSEAAKRKVAADRIQASLDLADQQLHALESRAGRAVEAYDAAAAQSVAAQRAAAEAQRRLVAANAAKDEANRRLGAFAAQSYRNGPDMTHVTTLMHISTLRELTDGEQALRTMARLEVSAIEAARAAERTATDCEAKASAAAKKAADAADAAAKARDAAQAAVGNEQGEVTRISGQRDVLMAQLAQAQGVAVALERQREEGLRIQAARAAAAAREAAREAALARQGGSRQWGALPNGAGAVHAMLSYIYAQLGKPYVWGGAGPDVFDCSGLAMRGLEAAGWQFPHPAQWQYLAMHPVGYSDLQPGDLVFWAEDDANPHTIYHEAIFIGGDRIIQAPRPGGVVEIQSLWVNGPPSFYGRP